MSMLKRYNYQILTGIVLATLFLVGAKTKMQHDVVSKTVQELPHLEMQGLHEQATELVPAQIPVFLKEFQRDMRPHILNIVKKHLPKNYKDRAYDIARAVIVEANHHNMDPLFLLAVIATESGFRPQVRGLHGEIGLMQILPSTAKWLAAEAGLSPEQVKLEDPVINIRIGATYFAQLRKTFNGKSARYVGAYNMGPANVRRLVAAKVEPKTYPGKVISNYKNFYSTIIKATAKKPLKKISARERQLASIQ